MYTEVKLIYRQIRVHKYTVGGNVNEQITERSCDKRKSIKNIDGMSNIRAQ